MRLDGVRAFGAVTLLCASCAVMICAWYLHLRFLKRWNLGQAVLISWLIAGIECESCCNWPFMRPTTDLNHHDVVADCLQVPGNRLGVQAGFSAAQLRAIAEVAILLAFLVFQVKVLAQPLLWNHVIGFATVLAGVLMVLLGPFNTPVVTTAPSAIAVQRIPSSGLEDAGDEEPFTSEFEFLHGKQSFTSRAELEHEMESSPPTVVLPSSPPLSPPPLAPPPSAAPRFPLSVRLAWLEDASHHPREQALAELEALQKRGHWIWWAFPTLASRGGDMNSAWQRADLADLGEARAYASSTALRLGLLRVLRAARTAFERVEARGDTRAPWVVLDKGFGRAAHGSWVQGPVDSFKAWVSATLFAALALEVGDKELHRACRDVLVHFRGDIVYEADGPGTAGFVEGGGVSMQRNALLQSGDPLTLMMLDTGGD